MKLTLSKIFDANATIKRFAEAKVQGIDDFVNGISDMSDRFISVLRNNVSLADNIDCREKDLAMTHNVLLVIEAPERIKKVKHIVPGRTLSFDNPVTALSWRYNAQGNIDLKAQFLGSPTTPVTVSIVMYF